MTVLKSADSNSGEGFLAGLILQFEAIHQKQHAPGVAGAEEELDDGGGSEGLAGAGGHLEQEAVFAVLHGPLQGVNGLQLIGPQETAVCWPGCSRGARPRSATPLRIGSSGAGSGRCSRRRPVPR